MARGITYRTLWPGERYELVDHSRMAKALYFLDQKYVPTTLGYGIILNLLDGNNLKYSGGYRGFYYLEDDYFPFIKYEKNDANSINNYGKSLLDNCKRSVEKFSGKITQQDNEIISDFKYWNKPYKRLYWNNYYRRSQDDIDKSDLADITDLNKIDISDDPVPAKGRYIPKIRDPIARKTIDSLFYSEIPKLQKAYKEYIAVPNTRKFDELIVEYLYFMEMVGRGIARTCPDVPMINESEETVVQRDETRKYEALINENPGSDRVKIMEIIEILNGGRFFFVNTNMVRVALTVLKPVNFSNYWEDTSSSTDILGKLYSAYDIMQEIIISKGIKAKNMDNMTELIFYECRKCFDSGIDPVYGLTGIDIRSNGIWRKQLNNFYDGRDPMYAIEIPEKRNKPEIER
jgi:hypothetical protein